MDQGFDYFKQELQKYAQSVYRIRKFANDKLELAKRQGQRLDEKPLSYNLLNAKSLGALINEPFRKAFLDDSKRRNQMFLKVGAYPPTHADYLSDIAKTKLKLKGSDEERLKIIKKNQEYASQLKELKMSATYYEFAREGVWIDLEKNQSECDLGDIPKRGSLSEYSKFPFSSTGRHELGCDILFKI